MAYSVSIEGFRPAPRYNDSGPWVRVRVDEAPDAAGPWTAIDEQPLDPVDVNPENPAVRNVTTDAATLTAGWYRLAFLTAGGDEQETDPVPTPGRGAPSGSELRAWAAPFNFAAVGYPEPGLGVADPLDRVAVGAVAYVLATTCRRSWEDIPADLRPIAEDVVVMRAQQRASGSSARSVRGASLGIKSFRAGDYSETRGDAADARKAFLLNPWPDLSDMLWALMTPECRAARMAELGGKAAPAGLSVSTVAQSWGGVDGYDCGLDTWS